MLLKEQHFVLCGICSQLSVRRRRGVLLSVRVFVWLPRSARRLCLREKLVRLPVELCLHELCSLNARVIARLSCVHARGSLVSIAKFLALINPNFSGRSCAVFYVGARMRR